MIGLSAGGDKLSQVKLHSTPLKGCFVSIAPTQPFVNTQTGRKPKKFKFPGSLPVQSGSDPDIPELQVLLHIVGQCSLVSAAGNSHLHAVACNGCHLVQHNTHTVYVMIQHLSLIHI